MLNKILYNEKFNQKYRIIKKLINFNTLIKKYRIIKNLISFNEKIFINNNNQNHA